MRRLLQALSVALIVGSSACVSTRQKDDLSDPATKVRIEALLRGRRDLDLKYVTVNVDAGVVTLSGIVPNSDQLRIIRRLASGVNGVEQVLNNLLIQE